MKFDSNETFYFILKHAVIEKIRKPLGIAYKGSGFTLCGSPILRQNR